MAVGQGFEPWREV